MEFLSDLKAQLAADGFHFDPAFHDGPDKWHKVKKPQAPMGGAYACRLFPNGAIVSYVSWDRELKKTWQAFSTGYVNGEANEIEETKRFISEKADKVKTEANEKAAIEASALWDQSSDIVPDFIPPYLQRKHLTGDFGTRTDATATKVFVRMRDIEGKTWGIQTIHPSGEKRFIKGQRKEGTFHLIGEINDKTEKIYISEGFGTSASVYCATQRPTVVAWDAGNLVRCAKIFRTAFPNLGIIIAGDNDESQTGQKAAEAAAKEVGGYAFYPSTPGKDWNDCLVEKGKEFLAETFRLFEEGLASEPKLSDEKLKRKAEKGKLILRTVGEILDNPQKEPNWICDKLFARGSISAIYGKPKAGKSTLSRQLAHHIATNQLFLGRKTTPGSVIYVGMEEKQHKMTRHYELMKTPRNAQLYAHCSTVPQNFFKQLEEQIKKISPVLIVLDTLGKCIQVKEDKYEHWVKELTPYSELAWEYDCHILFVHHAKKGEVNEDSALGSQAIRACMDVNLWLTRDEKDLNKRIFWGESRDWEDIEKSVLIAKKETQTFNAGGTVIEVKQDKRVDTLRDYLKELKLPKSKSDIQDALGLNWDATKSVIDSACRIGCVKRLLKAGNKGSDLFEYVEDFISPEDPF